MSIRRARRAKPARPATHRPAPTSGALVPARSPGSSAPRRLATALISFTGARTRQLKLTSFDRLFPSQDTLPSRKRGTPSGPHVGGFGNLIALPMQKLPRELGRSVFVDETLQPFPDQWAYLTSVRPMVPHDIEPTIFRANGGAHPLDVTFVADEDALEPWKPRPSANQ